MPHTPEDLAITPRQFQGDITKTLKSQRYWHNNDPVSTHFFNALQAQFPEAERFFIDAVRDTVAEVGEHNLPAPLRDQVKQFIRQEAMHGREHDRMNQALAETGYPHIGEKAERQGQARKRLRQTLPVRQRMALTAAAEHITSSFATLLLQKQPERLQQAAPIMKDLFTYHCLEEIEHKAVCYDLYQFVYGGYWRRVTALLYTLLDQMVSVSMGHRYLLAQDQALTKTNRRRARQMVWGRGGLVRGLAPLLLRFFKPGFHPWQQDERALLKQFDRFQKA